MLCASSDVILPVKRKARRRTIAAREEGREREIEFLLTCCQHVDSSLLMEAPKRREMSRDQFDSMRDVGLAILVMTSNAFDVSSRTFVLASKIFDKYLEAAISIGAEEQLPTPTPDTHHATAQSMEIPLACFVLACKFVETYALRLIDVLGIVDNSVTAHTLHAAENTVLDVLGWDIDLITGLDVLDKLLCRATPFKASMLRDKAELFIKVACCSQNLAKVSPGEVAVGVLLFACEQQELAADFLDFVPNFMMTDAAQRWREMFKAFVSDLRPTEQASTN